MDAAQRGFSQSLWLGTGGKEPEFLPLAKSHTADVVIVGGGFTGLSCALHLAGSGKSVTLLEAHDIGWGASGRNGGQVNPGANLMPSEIMAIYGARRGQQMLSLLEGACALVFELIDRHHIDCALRRAPYFRAAYGARGLKDVENWARELGALGAPVSLKNQSETHCIIGSAFFQGGLEDARGGSLQPLSYARGLADVAARAGARICPHTRAIKLESDHAGWAITTANGARIAARSLVLATNGYTNGLWPGLKRQIVPVASLQAATAPLPPDILRTILPRGHHFSDTRNIMVYCRVDETGRFQIGGRGSPFSPTVQQADTGHLKAKACEIFPQLEGVDWEFEWGGLVAITRNHMPHLIELAKNAYAGLGYNGRGIAMATVMGKQLAGLVAGQDITMPLEKLSPFVMHRFRNFGIGWHMIAGQWRDARENR